MEAYFRLMSMADVIAVIDNRLREVDRPTLAYPKQILCINIMSHFVHHIFQQRERERARERIVKLKANTRKRKTT